MRLLVGHTKDVRSVAYLPDGHLVSGGSDRTVRIWNPTTGELEETVRSNGPVYAVAATPDGSAIAYAGRHAGLEATATPIHTYRVHDRAMGAAFQFPYQTLPASLVRFYANGYPRSVWSLAYSADSQTLTAVGRVQGGGNMSNGAGGHWFRTDASDQGPLASPEAFALAFDPNSNRLAITSASIVRIYQTPQDAQPIVDYHLQSRWAAAVIFMPNSPMAVVGVNSMLYIIDSTRRGKPRRVKTGFRTVTALGASSDQRHIIVTGKPGGVELYHADTMELRLRFDFKLGGVHSLAVAPDGLTIAIGADEGLAVFDWDM